MFAIVASACALTFPAFQETPQEEEASRIELKAAASRITNATAYRFDVAAQLGGQPEGAGESVVKLAGQYVRCSPLHLQGASLEMLRLSGKMVFRHGDGDWRLLEPAAAGAPGAAEADQACPGPGRESGNALLRAASVLPAPHEVLEALDGGGKDLSRQVEAGASGRIVYEATLEGEPLRELLQAVADPDAVVCSVRVTTTSAGDIEEVHLNVFPRDPPAPPFPGESGDLAITEVPRPCLTFVYTLKDADADIQIDVPQEAYTLLLG